MLSGLPSWDDFAIRLLTSSGSADEQTARTLLSRQDPMIVVEAARDAAECDSEWERLLRRALYSGISVGESLVPSPLHEETVGHYLEQPEKTSLITLNFDTLIEQVLQDATGETVSSVTDRWENNSSPSVHHLHGIITPKEIQDVVLTIRDFTTLIERRNSWQVSYLEKAVKRGALIIAGTSYRDPDLRQWLHKALLEKPEGHKAFVLLAREGFEVSKEDFDQLKRPLSDQWKAIGLQPVLLQDHSDAAQIIRELRHINNDGYLAPQERCQMIWDEHQMQFHELQANYVNLLSSDAAMLKREIGVENIDLTLWMSNGQGELVRWASQDRIYRDLATLRRISTGHDSDWIAGMALGEDSQLFEELPESPTRRWRSVLAVPVRVAVPRHHLVSSAVLTIGLPDKREVYLETMLTWEEKVLEMVDEWGQRLEDSVRLG